MRLKTLIEPRGGVKFCQILVSIVTLVVVFGINEILSVNINCKPYDATSTAVDVVLEVIFKYPFSIKTQEMTNCNNQTIVIENIDLSHSGASGLEKL